jgi:hypothetical protein
MKGEQPTTGARWHGNPARPVALAVTAAA